MEPHSNPLKVKGESIFTDLAGKKAFKCIYKVEIALSNFVYWYLERREIIKYIYLEEINQSNLLLGSNGSVIVTNNGES